jgi:hypothetical protein
MESGPLAAGIALRWSPRSWLEHAPAACGVAVAALGLAVLVGWWLEVPLLKSVLPGIVSMKANAALAFVVPGTGLALVAADRPAVLRGRTGQVLALAALLIGLLTFSQYAVGWDLGIDELLFRDDPGAAATPIPGRMAPPRPSVLLFWDWRWRPWTGSRAGASGPRRCWRWRRWCWGRCPWSSMSSVYRCSTTTAATRAWRSTRPSASACLPRGRCWRGRAGAGSTMRNAGVSSARLRLRSALSPRPRLPRLSSGGPSGWATLPCSPTTHSLRPWWDGGSASRHRRVPERCWPGSGRWSSTTATAPGTRRSRDGV